MSRRRLASAALLLAPAVAGCHGSSAPAHRSAAAATPSVSRSAAPTSPAPPRRLQARTASYRLPAGLSRTVGLRTGHRVLLLAGLAAGDVTTGQVVRVDPATGRTRAAGSLGQPVHDATGARLGGRALVFGGGAATEMATVQAWSPGHAGTVGSLPRPRSDSAAAVVGGTAYVVGGFDGSRLDRTVLATTDGHTFRVVGHLRQGVRYPAVTAAGGAVWVMGGELATVASTSGGPETAAIQRFDPRTGRTRVVGRLPHPLGHAMAFTLAGSVFVAGGRRTGVATDRIWRIDPTGSVHAAGRLPLAESDAAAVTVGSTAWLFGGEAAAGPTAPLRSVVAVRYR